MYDMEFDRHLQRFLICAPAHRATDQGTSACEGKIASHLQVI